ncbi:MAG TPA: IclR family transcriptional regulator [Bacillales bacterium]|nr:IclR family transcriptional regulator [Bacillales bacterium]
MVQSIERAMKIINILRSNPHKRLWSISEVAENVDLPPSSVHRLISALMKNGLIAQDQETKRYQVGYAWMEIGFWLHDHLDFREIARPIMEQLAQDVQESVYFSIPHGDVAVIIERIDSPSNVRIIDNLGERIPLDVGAANKSMLAFMNPSETNRLIHRLVQSAADKQKLFVQLDQIRTNGFSFSSDEKTKGTTSIAAPVFGKDGKVVGSLYINMLTEENELARSESLARKVMDAAERVSKLTGRAP